MTSPRYFPHHYLVRFLLLIFALQALTACGEKDKTYHAQLVSLGTLIDISIWNIKKDKADTVIHEIENRLNAVHQKWHAWNPGRLVEINKHLANGETVNLTTVEYEHLVLARDLAIASDHLFNPAIGKLITLWGFHSDDPPAPPPPAVREIRKLVAEAPNMQQLHFDALSLSSSNSEIELDLGGFAKGYAVDQAISILKNHGINNAIINAGGDLRAIGTHGNRPWRIGIRHPDGQGVIASITTNGDESVFTSGNYERYYDYQGERFHHIIDPRTGFPAKGTRSVTVIHSDGATADAAATALFVAGPDQWQKIARQMHISRVMLIDEHMNIHMTPEMAERIHFEQNIEKEIIITPVES
ncbi:MAG: FAD:protein FMN transferase [Gammaproteobacteria bacterium]